MKIIDNITNEIATRKNFDSGEKFGVDMFSGTIADTHTGNYNLDFFALAGSSRKNPDLIEGLFSHALYENPVLAIQNLLYLRNPRGGLGERNLFRVALRVLIDEYPDYALSILPSVVEYGRWDDVLVYLEFEHTQRGAAQFIRKQLEKDLAYAEKGEREKISLCAKWMPSINTSSNKTRSQARALISLLGISNKKYRKMLSNLRKGKIVERYLTEQDYTFSYEKVPSYALRKYELAFRRNDFKRWNEYIENVISGKSKINAQILFPHQVIAHPIKSFTDFIYRGSNDTMSYSRYDRFDQRLLLAQLEELKKSIPVPETRKHTLIVRDASQRSYGSLDFSLNVATALTVLLAESLPEPFRNRYISLNEKPHFVELNEEENSYGKMIDTHFEFHQEGGSLDSVYDIVLSPSKEITDEADYIGRLVIISDMKVLNVEGESDSYGEAKMKFEAAGVPMPEVVFWNVGGNHKTFATDHRCPNVKLISGYSPHIFSMLLEDVDMTPAKFMLRVLSPYETALYKKSYQRRKKR